MDIRTKNGKRSPALWITAALALVTLALIGSLFHRGQQSQGARLTRPRAGGLDPHPGVEEEPRGSKRLTPSTSVNPSPGHAARSPLATAQPQTIQQQEPSTRAGIEELLALLRELREIEGRLEGAPFFDQAQAVVERARRLFLESGQVADEALESALSDPLATARYRGTIFFVMGASDADRHRSRLLGVAGHESEQEARRGAIWGLAAWGSDERPKPYGVASYYEKTRFAPMPWFDVRLDRAVLASPLIAPLLRIAEDASLEQLTREAAALVLGQALDTEPRVFETCMAHLKASPWHSDEMIRTWVYVAAHASRAEALESLLGLAQTLLAHPDDDDQAMQLLCELVVRHPVPEVLNLVLGAIRSENAGYIERNMLMLKLGKALGTIEELEAGTAQAIASTLYGIAIENPDRITRMSAMLSLLNVDRPQALALLDTALASDPDPMMRRSSARAVAESFDPPRALELLEAAFARETDPDVRLRIVHAIGRVPLAAATLALERMLPHAEGELLDAIQAALERSRGR